MENALDNKKHRCVSLKVIFAIMFAAILLLLPVHMPALAAYDADAPVYLTYTQWQKTENPDGDITYTWDNVTDRIERLARKGLELYYDYENGGTGIDYIVVPEGREKELSAYVNKEYNYKDCLGYIYGRWYDTCGFEKMVNGFISGARVTEMELKFSEIKKLYNQSGNYDALCTSVDELVENLRTDAAILDEIFYSEDGGSNTFWPTFLACFGIMIREGLEAVLIVSALAAYMAKTGNKDKLKWIYIGVAVAVAASFLLAFLINLIKMSTTSQEVIEGVTALIAVVVIVYVSNWLISKSETEAWTKYLNKSITNSVNKGGVFSIAFTAFLAVFREGAEVVLFYQPMITATTSIGAVWLGLGLGIALILVVYFLIRVYSIKLPLKPFFMATSILMSIMAVAFIGAGIWELLFDSGVLNASSQLISPSLEWMIENEVLNFFGIYPVWGTIIPQIILFIALTVLFIIQLKKNKKLKAKADSKNAIDDALEESVESDEVSEIQEGEADTHVAEATKESAE